MYPPMDIFDTKIFLIFLLIFIVLAATAVAIYEYFEIYIFSIAFFHGKDCLFLMLVVVGFSDTPS